MERNVPKLRFKGFNDEWEEYRIGDLCRVDTGNKDTQNKVDNGIYPFFVRSQNVERINTYSYDGEAILTAGDGVGVGKVFHYVNCKFDYHQRVYKLSDFNNVNGKFLYMYFSKNFKRETVKYNAKTSVDSVRREMITKMKIIMPSMVEQERIANFLTKVDKIIEKQDEKVKNLEKYKKGMMQKIFSQEIRFKDENGKEYPEWNKEHLGNLVERVVRKNKGNISNRPLTISAKYGLVDQEEFFNKVVASSNLEGYYLLENGEFAYNKSYSNGYPFGAIKRLDKYDDGAVSTLYICFKPKNGLSSDFLCHYFESDMWHKEVAMVAVEGARNHGLLNISVGDFFDTIHKVPCKKEQIQIANFLNNISNLLYKEENKFKELQKWKKALLQQMFV